MVAFIGSRYYISQYRMNEYCLEIENDNNSDWEPYHFQITKNIPKYTVKTEILEKNMHNYNNNDTSVVFQFCLSKHFCKFAMNSSIDSIKYLKTNLFIEVKYPKQRYSTTAILRCRSTMIETFGNPSLDWCSNSEAGLWSTKDTKSWYKVTIIVKYHIKETTIGFRGLQVSYIFL